MTLPARYLLPHMPASLEGLEELALDMHWSWSHSADAIWRTINEELWQRTRNPWLILIDISDARLQRLASDRDFTELVQHELARFQAAASAPGWFEQQACADELGQVAYFCMEFGLCEALPIYSGGLGMLAGDTLKTASELGVPMTGVGLRAITKRRKLNPSIFGISSASVIRSGCQDLALRRPSSPSLAISTS